MCRIATGEVRMRETHLVEVLLLLWAIAIVALYLHRLLWGLFGG